MDKVTLIEAARLVDLHPNTVRNWRKSGKLKTAEKVLDNNVETWVVDPQEVHQLANPTRSTNGVNNRSYTVDAPDGQPNPDQVNQTPGAAISPVQEQTIAFMRESVVRPLVEANERQAARLEQLSRENGALSAELRLVKERLDALEADRLATAAQEATKPSTTVGTPSTAHNQPQAAQEPEPSPILNRDTLQPVTTENRKSFWQRVFGG